MWVKVRGAVVEWVRGVHGGLGRGEGVERCFVCVWFRGFCGLEMKGKGDGNGNRDGNGKGRAR